MVVEVLVREVVALVLLVGVLHLVARRLPRGARRVIRAAFVVGLFVVIACALLRWVQPHNVRVPLPSLRDVLLVWVITGLPLYGLWRAVRGADARAKWNERVNRARSSERRRAQPPLPQGPTPRGAPRARRSSRSAP